MDLEDSQVIEKMERETGLEPATSSLGRESSFENKEQLRQRRQTQVIQNQGNHAFLPRTGLIAVNAVRILGLLRDCCFGLKILRSSEAPANVRRLREVSVESYTFR